MLDIGKVLAIKTDTTVVKLYPSEPNMIEIAGNLQYYLFKFLIISTKKYTNGKPSTTIKLSTPEKSDQVIKGYSL